MKIEWSNRARTDLQNLQTYIFSMKTFEEILQEAARLPPNQRLSLAHRLLLLSEPSPSPEVDEAWDSVIRERIMRYDQGETQARPASEVFSELDDQLSTRLLHS